MTQGKWATTFCGTPEYICPEILLGLGHDKSVDWWSLGAIIFEMLVGSPPHYSKSRKKMFKRITGVPIKCPEFVDEDAASLISGLLTINPGKRLGFGKNDANPIKEHEFFKDINWDDLLKKKIDAPWKPKLKHA